MSNRCFRVSLIATAVALAYLPPLVSPPKVLATELTALAEAQSSRDGELTPSSTYLHRSSRFLTPADPQSQTPQRLELSPQERNLHDNELMLLGQLGGLTLQSADRNTNPLQISMRSATQGLGVMQDRVYFSPAPYSAPQLQLLPNPLLQQSVSISPLADGASGGQGSFGTLDYQTLTISQPQSVAGVMFEGAAEGDAHAGMHWGVKQQQYGMVLAADHRRNLADDDVTYGAAADSQTTDLLFKVNAESLVGARSPQFTEFSYQFYDDDSYRSPIGLTASDWLSGQQPGYSATASDKHDGQRHKYQLAHHLLQGNRRVITDFYYQSYEQQVSQLSQFNGQPIDNDVLAAIAQFDKQPEAAGSQLTTLNQDNDYSAFGVQTQSINQYGQHQVTYRLRYHTDKAQMRVAEQARFWQADRSIVSGERGQPLAYRDEASAFTSTIDSRLRWQDLQIMLALTYEDVEVSRQPELAEQGLELVDFSDSDWLPQLGVAYQMRDWRLSADIRRAWSAASAGNAKQEAQASLHYQLKLQYEREAVTAQLTAYQQEFDNLHVDCAAYSQCTDSRLLTQENIADVHTYGVELGIGYRAQLSQLQFPLSVNYQYVNAQHQSANCTAFLGCVSAGEALSWLPEQQWQLNAGLSFGHQDINLRALYQSERDFTPLGAAFAPIPAGWRVDLVANYAITEQHGLYVRIENMLDESLVTTASNSGIHLANGRISYLGYQWHF